MYEAVPEELKQLNQWCCFKLEKRNNKTTKIPMNANNGNYAKSNDESTWADFDSACAAIKQFNFDGLGFFFKKPYFGIDIDDVKQDIDQYLKSNESENIVAEFVETMESYTEISPSGNGIHIIVKGELPKGGRRKSNVEMYAENRFFTITGNAISRFTDIYDDSDLGKINYLHQKYIASNEIATSTSEKNQQGNQLSIDDIIDVALKSKNATRFKLFMTGGWEQFYESQSEADMAFANDLAFWTACDYDKMDDIFRKSSLYRDKWDEKRGEQYYNEITLNKAISSCHNVFSPQNNDDEYNLYVNEIDTKKVNNRMYSYDDSGNAERLTDAYGDFIRYSYIRKSWYYYNGMIWQIDQSGKVKSLTDKVNKNIKKEPLFMAEDVDEEEAAKHRQKHLKYSRGSNGKTNMLKESQHLLNIQPSDFDKDMHLLNTQNGYLDLQTGQLNNHDKTKMFTKIAAVEYTDKIDCPQWMDFMYQIFHNDSSLVNYLQRAIGYSLCGSTEEQMMFILYGNGRNGKSVFLDIITEMLGNYTANIQPQTLMVKQQTNNASPDIAKLDGARLVTTTEPNEGMRFDEGLIKQLTGGDRVTARFLHENEFEFTPQFKIWMATNHKPFIRGTDDGIWRRLAIVPFTVQIPEHEVDRNLKYKLQREMKGILNWAVEGYQEWKRIGLNEPNVVKKQRNEYRTEMDVIELFIEECCFEDDNEATVQASTIYNVYKDWAKENGQYLMNSTKFGKEMNMKFNKTTVNGLRKYRGLSLLNDSSSNVYKLSL